MWSSTDLPSTEYFRKLDYWFGMTEYMFLRLSECLNPIFYNFGSPKMRKCTFKLLYEKFPCLVPSKTASDNSIARSSVITTNDI